ncbi:MAG: DUF4342 domain-containing protein [Candidatus Promineofilum sp.]|nr:DUF4342 domain-containing protein [Promineifilum sp.]
MTDEMIPMTEETAEAGRTFTERVSVTGGELVETVQGLLREAAVRKITIQDKDGRTLVEIPLYAGIAGALVLGSATVLALIAAWFAQVSILIERDRGHDGGPSVVGEAVERAAGSASSAATQVVGGVTAFFGGATRGAGDAARRMADALEARLGRAADSTNAAAEQAAESAEAAAETVSETADDVAMKVGETVDAAAEQAAESADALAMQVGVMTDAATDMANDAADSVATRMEDAADALSDMAPERQCAAITKAGSRCKRPAMDGSEFCSMHQVA